MSKKIIIYNHPYYFGGTVVLSCLCKTLRELGYDARVMFAHHFKGREDDEEGSLWKNWYWFMRVYASRILHRFFPKLKFLSRSVIPENPVTTMPGIKIQYNPFFWRPSTIIIYPECLMGNPLLSIHSLRWLLYFNKFKEGQKAFGKNEFVVAYREVFNDPKLNPECYTLRTPYFDSALYRRYNFGNRSGKCYIVRKGSNRADLPEKFDGTIIDNLPEEEKVRVFNECEECYSYDTQTFYCSIAMLCGCESIVVMEPGKTEKDYLSPGETHYGVAYGDTAEQRAFAQQTREKRIAQLDFAKQSRESVKKFVPILEKRFGKLKRI